MPLAAPVNEALSPAFTEVETGLSVITAGLEAPTDSVNACVTEPALFVAETTNEKGEPVVLFGVPLIAPVRVFSEAHGGKVPLTSPNVGVGVPLAVSVNELATPKEKVALFALVKTGAWLTVSVNTWVAGAPTPLLA